MLEKLSIKNEDGTNDQYSFRHLYQMEIGEDLVFDKQRSIPVYQVKYITLIIPQEINYRGIHEALVTFRFQDCRKLFIQDGHDEVSFNKEKVKINFRDAILLHMYKAEIVKMGDEDDLYFDQKYPKPSDAFLARKRSEEEVLEYFYRIYNPE